MTRTGRSLEADKEFAAATDEFAAATDRAGSGASRGPLGRVFEGAILALNGLGTVWIFALMFLICADVAMRYLFNRPIDGVTDIAAFSITGIVFLQIAATVRSGRMTRGDALLEWLGSRAPTARHLIEASYLAVGALVFALLVRASWPLLTRSFQRSEYFGVEGVFTFPNWPVRAIVVIGAAAAAVVYLIQVVRQLRLAFSRSAR